jgi:hypothetical protein
VGDGEYQWRIGERSGILAVPGLGGGLAILPDERLVGILERDGASEVWVMQMTGSVERTIKVPKGFEFYYFPDSQARPDIVVCSRTDGSGSPHRDWHFRFDADTGALEKLDPIEQE